MKRRVWPEPRLRPELRLLGGRVKDYKYNACIGRQYPDEMASGCYRDGFRDAAALLVHAITDGNPWVDTLVYPTVFLCRHYVELLLKSLYAEATEVLEGDPEYAAGHDLLKIWQKLQPLIERALPKADWSQNREVTRILKEFARVDAAGDAFRYSASLTGQRHLAKETLLNIAHFHETVTALTEYLEEVSGGLESVNPRRCY